SIDTDPARTTTDSGWCWEVAVPEVSSRASVRDARANYDAQIAARGKPSGVAEDSNETDNDVNDRGSLA
ncbi:3D-(3,5/4)-trihydroxycyclohexane-1,2-dione acylhydrolase (decyclizing), partial [Burkholderia sp. SIMBA_024]